MNEGPRDLMNNLDRFKAFIKTNNQELNVSSALYLNRFFGFFFWLVVFRNFSPFSIGISNTIMATGIIIGQMSNFGMNTFMIRVSKRANYLDKKIMGILIFVITICIFGILGYTIYLAFFASQSLFFFYSNNFVWVAFMLIIFSYAINYLEESWAIIKSSTFWLPIRAVISGLGKILLIFALREYFAAENVIIWAFALGQIIGTMIIFVILKLHLFFLTKPELVSRNDFKTTSFYSIFYILSGLFSLIIFNFVYEIYGETYAAYFTLAWNIAILLHILPRAASTVFLSKIVDNSITNIIVHIKNITLFIVPITTVGFLLLVVFGKLILSLFGEGYIGDAYFLLIILSFAVIPSIPIHFGFEILRALDKHISMIIFALVKNIIYLLLFYLNYIYQIPTGPALVYTIGHLIFATFLVIYVYKLLERHKRKIQVDLIE
jgi:O-antigen/teichoic acid export membrane protein